MAVRPAAVRVANGLQQFNTAEMRYLTPGAPGSCVSCAASSLLLAQLNLLPIVTDSYSVSVPGHRRLEIRNNG